MASVRVEVDPADKQRLRLLFDGIEERSQNWAPFWPVVQATMHRSILQNFREQGRPHRWRPLSAWTLRVRRGRTSSSAIGGDILQDTGSLRQSIGIVNRQTKRSFTYGTNLIYARLMHYGGVVLPRRAKHLTLPFPGVTGGARDYNNTFVITTSRSKIMWQSLDGGGARPLFLLKKRVNIPARPFVMFQTQDVDKISAYAMAYVLDPKKFATLAIK